MAEQLRYTWDGLPIAPDEPYGASIMVRRHLAGTQSAEYLVLHRAHHGPDFDGDWAWTPPAGSRQPGEPVLAAALRELAEESGLAAAGSDLRPLDLSGRWVRFRLDVPPDAEIRLDHEHDRFEWLPVADAISRCQPAQVAHGLRLAERAIAGDVAFRPLAAADLADMVAWRAAPHAAPWFPEVLDLATAQRKYGPRIRGSSPTRVHVAVADGQACGFLQHYRVRDYPEYAGITGEPDAVAIDYAIGLPDLVGRGLGPQLIWLYVMQVVLAAHPAARLVLASPDTANARSIRALAKAAFRPLREIAVGGGQARELLCVLDVKHFLG